MQVSNFRFIGREVKEKGIMLMKTHHRVEMRQEVTGRKPQDLEFSDLFWVQMHKRVCVCAHAFPHPRVVCVCGGLYPEIVYNRLRGCTGALGARGSHPESCQGENLRCTS